LSIDNRDRRSRALEAQIEWSNRITLCTVTARSALKGWLDTGNVYISRYIIACLSILSQAEIITMLCRKCQWILCQWCNYVRV